MASQAAIFLCSVVVDALRASLHPMCCVGITEQNIYPLFNVLPLPFGFASTYSSHARAFMVSASAFS